MKMLSKTKIVGSILLALMTMSFTACDSTNTDNNTTSGGNSPTITLEGPTDINISLGTTSILVDGDKYSAYDIEDGDLSTSVKRTHDIDFSKAGTYRITYYVVDSNGYSDTKYRVVTIKSADYQPYNGNTTYTGSVPVISFTDGDTRFLNVGAFYDRFTYLASDFEDGDLTQNVQIGGDSVDTATKGIYTVYYTVTDSDSNTVTKERTIYVGQNDFGTQVGTSDIALFKTWYSQTCGQQFNDSLYTASTGQYNGKINCSNSNLTNVDLTTLSIFSTIKSLDLSHNNLTYVDFNQLDLSVNNVKVLEDLDLSYNNLSDKSMFDPLHNLKNINRLWIQGNGFDYSKKSQREALYKTFNNRSLTIFF